MKFTYSFTVPALLLVLLFSLTGCFTTEEADEFGSTSTLPDGRALRLTGSVLDHAAGETSTFDVTLDNAASESWSADYCLLLTNANGVIAHLADSTFTLPPDQGVHDTIEVTMPEGMDQDRYGVTLLIPDVASLTGTIVPVSAPNQEVPSEAIAPIGVQCATGTLPDAESSIEREPFEGDLRPTPAE